MNGHAAAVYGSSDSGIPDVLQRTTGGCNWQMFDMLTRLSPTGKFFNSD